MLSKDLSSLVTAYLNQRSPYIKEQYLDLLAEKSTTENFLPIIRQMQEDPKLHELELSMYINEIARPDFVELMPIIAELRTTFKDKDALEDMDEAEAKINSHSN